MRDQRLTTLFLRFRSGGDTRALGELFDALSPELLRVARHVARDEAEAEDLVQATFLTALEYPERFDATRRLAPWMVGILTKEARSWGRGAARRPEPDRLLAEPIEREARERPDRLAVDAESRSLLKEALDRLPTLYRDVLSANLLRRMSPQEIAEERVACPATIRVQLHRGLARLRPMLPAGLAGGLVLTLSPRGTAALRSELLAAASRFTPVGALAATASVTTTLGSLLMLQRIGLGALAALVIFGLWRLTSSIEMTDAGTGEALALAPLLQANSHERLAAAHSDATARDSERTSLDAIAASTPLIPGLRVRTLWADGSAAPNIGFSWIASGTPGEAPGWAVTDEHGIALLDARWSAFYVFYGDRGGHGSASVDQLNLDLRKLDEDAAAALVESLRVDVTLQLEPGVDVSGRVLDRERRPVAGAEIWISNGLNRDTGSVVARTDADGRYLVRQLTDDCFVGARAEGHAPSGPEHVQYWTERGAPDGELELDLLLGGPAARVRGIVLDAQGRPVAGARVRVGSQDGFDTFGPTGAEGPPPPVEVSTDADGRFEATGIAPGSVGIACRAEHHAVCAKQLEVAENETAFAELRLQRGAGVHGILTTPDGRPIPGATVAVYQRAFRYPGPLSSFDEPRVETRDDGSFAIAGIAPGGVYVSVTTRDRKASDSIELELEDGEFREWTPQLTGLPEITGVALDERGATLPGWSVVARSDGPLGPPPVAAFTNAEGEFRLTFASEGTVQLILHAPDSGPEARRWTSDHVPRAWLEGVATDSRDVVLALDGTQAPTASLRADLVTEDGNATPKLLVTLSHERWGELLQRELEAGATTIELEELPSGSVSLRVEGAGLATCVLDGIELAPHTKHDAGALRLERAGGLRVELQREDGPAALGLDVVLTDSRGRGWWLGRDPKALERDDLPPGSYRLVVQATGCAVQTCDLRVESGERTTQRLLLERGTPLKLVLTDAAGQPLAEGAHLVVTTTTGRLVLEVELEPDQGGRVSRWISAPPGELRVRAETADGRRAEVLHRLGEGTPAGEPLLLRLR
ncbi:MAG: sigma-70 family RNA polymerase sigma factor [Planctomycetes bacterium]|nr:sigma-70 family RNA polymerase sigma factor [Planctomycetota bacterium]